MFKRIRVKAGDTLVVPVKANTNTARLVRGHITRGSGAPVARFQMNELDGANPSAMVGAETTSRMSGTYRYELAFNIDGVVKTVQYGILEVI